ncbi:NAD(P)H-dependent oxidoreductase [Alteromonas sp. A079]|uniref:NAD(P)H-dependent oxidoreductase n=1 Tax=Alteromonas sp. A079 TaxID=3410268 RepID=UPI003BA28B48
MTSEPKKHHYRENENQTVSHAEQSAQNVLVLFAHPAQASSEVNLHLFRDAKATDSVTAVDLYHDYPDFNIDIAREQQRLLEHDTIIFLFPLFWYSTPSILKEWQDLVLEYGFAYGQGGTALQGKKFLCAITAGGKEEAYQSDGFNHFTIRQLLQPLEQMASITQMAYIAPFALFGSRTAQEEQRIEGHRQKWQQLLNMLVNDTLNMSKATRLENLADLCTKEGDN